MLKILERIDLRSRSENQKQLLSELDQLVINLAKKKESDNIKIYMHHNIGSDFSIHLHRSIADNEKLESELGIRLADALKDFGFVNHSIWIEL